MNSKKVIRRIFGVPLAIASILTTLYLSHLWIDNTKELKLLLNQRPEIEEPVLKEGVPGPDSPDDNDSEDDVNTEEEETQEETPTPPEEQEEESKEEDKQEKEEDSKKDEEKPEEQDTDLPSIDNDLGYISDPGKIDILKYIKRKIQETNKYGYSWANTLNKLLSTWKVKNTTTSLLVVLKEFDAMLKKASEKPKPTIVEEDSNGA